MYHHFLNAHLGLFFNRAEIRSINISPTNQANLEHFPFQPSLARNFVTSCFSSADDSFKVRVTATSLLPCPKVEDLSVILVANQAGWRLKLAVHLNGFLQVSSTFCKTATGWLSYEPSVQQVLSTAQANDDKFTLEKRFYAAFLNGINGANCNKWLYNKASRYNEETVND